MKNEIKNNKQTNKTSKSKNLKSHENLAVIEKALKSDEKKLKKDEKDLSLDLKNLENLTEDIRKVSKVLISTGFVEFTVYLKSPWRIIWSNLLGGIFRGLGIIIGMTVVVALIIWIFSIFVNFPIIGEYFEDAQTKVIEYAEQTNYKTEFQSIEKELKILNKNLINQ